MDKIPEEKFQWLLKNVPLVACDPVAVRDGKILMMRRVHEPYIGTWVLPGGFLEYKEQTEACALRELREETSLRGEIVELLGVYSAPERDPRGHVLAVVYIVKAHGEVALNEEGSEFAWFGEAPRDISPVHAEIFADALKRIKALGL